MSVAANRYAKALIDALYPSKAEAGLEQLRRFEALFDEQPQARQLCVSPYVQAYRRKALLKEIGDVIVFSQELRNFIGILIDRNRLDILDEIVRAYEKYLDERLGIVRAVVSTAHPLDETQHEELA